MHASTSRPKRAGNCSRGRARSCSTRTTFSSCSTSTTAGASRRAATGSGRRASSWPPGGTTTTRGPRLRHEQLRAGPVPGDGPGRPDRVGRRRHRPVAAVADRVDHQPGERRLPAEADPAPGRVQEQGLRRSRPARWPPSARTAGRRPPARAAAATSASGSWGSNRTPACRPATRRRPGACRRVIPRRRADREQATTRSFPRTGADTTSGRALPPPRRAATFRHWTGQLGSHRHRTRFMGSAPPPPPPRAPACPRVTRTRSRQSGPCPAPAIACHLDPRRRPGRRLRASGGRTKNPSPPPASAASCSRRATRSWTSLQPAERDRHAGRPQGLLPGPQPARPGRRSGRRRFGRAAPRARPPRPGRSPPSSRTTSGPAVADQVGRHGQRQSHRPAAVCGRRATRLATRPAARGRRAADRGSGSRSGRPASSGPRSRTPSIPRMRSRRSWSTSGGSGARMTSPGKPCTNEQYHPDSASEKKWKVNFGRNPRN